jgi:hypothetical protein
MRRRNIVNQTRRLSPKSRFHFIVFLYYEYSPLKTFDPGQFQAFSWTAAANEELYVVFLTAGDPEQGTLNRGP